MKSCLVVSWVLSSKSVGLHFYFRLTFCGWTASNLLTKHLLDPTEPWEIIERDDVQPPANRGLCCIAQAMTMIDFTMRNIVYVWTTSSRLGSALNARNKDLLETVVRIWVLVKEMPGNDARSMSIQYGFTPPTKVRANCDHAITIITTTTKLKQASPENSNQKTNGIKKKERRDIGTYTQNSDNGDDEDNWTRRAQWATSRAPLAPTIFSPELILQMLLKEHYNMGRNSPYISYTSSGNLDFEGSEQLLPSLMLGDRLLFTIAWLG